MPRYDSVHTTYVNIYKRPAELDPGEGIGGRFVDRHIVITSA